MQPSRIVVVVDEADLRDRIVEYLSVQGFDVVTANGGPAVCGLLNETTPDLVLLDIAMPCEDGLALARDLREHHDVAIIVLTAASDVVERVLGLEMDADDYLTKPFDPRELLARIKSVLRRTGRASQLKKPAPGKQELVRFGPCVLNTASHQLFGPEGEEITITSMEYDLLQAFATHPNRVLSRDQLLNLAHNRDWEPFDRSIDIRVTRLRKKVELDPSKPQTIKTVRGAGYVFVPARE